MPNLVLEKGGQTYRFGLHTDKTVTNGKAVPVEYNGTTYYARYDTANTPLKTEVNGQTYYIQYDVVAFTRYYWERRASDTSNYSTTLFFPKGQYRGTVDGQNVTQRNFTVSSSGNRTVSISFSGTQYNKRFTCTISGVFNEYVIAGNNWNKLTIERIGD